MRNWMLIVLLNTVFGCGPSNTNAGERRILPPALGEMTTFANYYFLADADCQEQVSRVSLDQVTTHFYIDQSVQEMRSNVFLEVGDDKVFRGAIKEVNFDFHQRSRCRFGDGELECDDLAEVISQPRRLGFCQDEGDYPRYSYEGISLTTVAGLELAREFYLSIDGHKGFILPTRVLTLPMVERVVERGSLYQGSKPHSYVITDNLGYTPSFRGQPTFIVFPKGAHTKKNGLWPDVSLWESPMVLAHEYAHHVFNTHVGSRASSALVLPHSQDESVDELYRQSSKAAFGLQGSLISRVDTAVNEGFSDLFAHQALSELEGNIWQLDCFTDIRDPKVGVFPGEIKKELRTEYLDYLVKLKPFEPQSHNCHYPNFSNVHTIGAIIAFGIQSILNEFHHELSPSERASLLVSWLDRVSEQPRPAQDHLARMAYYLVPVLNLLHPGSESANGSLYCDMLSEVFPFLQEVGQASQSIGCDE